MRPIRKVYVTMGLCVGALVLLYLLDSMPSGVKSRSAYHDIALANQRRKPVSPEHKGYVQARENLENKHITLTLAMVVCGDRVQQAFTLIKSALVFQMKHPISFIILAEDNIIPSLEEKLSDWQLLKVHTFKFEILTMQYPKDKEKEWKILFKKCASERLFLPDILPHVDALLYLDIDTVFLGPVYDVWSQFYKMNASQMVGLAPESENMNSGWYNRFARHPYYGKQGVNSGVMLMNLTRMRSFGWGNYLGPIFKEFKTRITFGDQDIINIIFYYHPEKLLVFPCRYNYRSDHCNYMPNCKSASAEGVIVLHGSRETFMSHKVPAFSVIHQAFQEYQLGQDVHERLYEQLESYLSDTKSTPCGKDYKQVYLKEMQRVLQPWTV